MIITIQQPSKLWVAICYVAMTTTNQIWVKLQLLIENWNYVLKVAIYSYSYYSGFINQTIDSLQLNLLVENYNIPSDRGIYNLQSTLCQPEE